MNRTLLSVVLALLLAVADLASQGGTITGVVVDVRERENGDHSLLVQAESSAQIDRIRFNLPQRFTFAPGFVPSEWKVLAQGRRIEASGDRVFRVNLRLDAKPNENLIRNLTGKEIEVEVGIPGTGTTFKYKTKVNVRPPVRSGGGNGGSVVLPPEIRSGAPFLFSFDPSFKGGVWVSGIDSPADVARRSEAARKIAEAARRTQTSLGGESPARKWMRIHDAIAGHKEPDVMTYVDPWDEALIGVEYAVLPAQAASCNHGITGGTPMAFAGKDACLQGCFGDKLTDLDKAAVFLLDGKVEVTPQAASPTTVVVRIPADTTPGPHELGWTGVPGQLNIRILQVQGSIDQKELWRGQSTTMRLQILGSDEQIPLKIVNGTPATITVEGGNEQVISTSGGAINVVNRQVKGIMKGDFTIDYSVDQPPCGR